MNRRLPLVPLSLTAGLLAVGGARAQTPPGGVVRQIVIVHKGTANVGNDLIRAKLTEKLGTVYDPAAAQADEAALKAMGVFHGPVTVDAAPDPAGGVDLTYTVAENPVIKSIVFTADTPDGRPSVPADALKSRMTTKEGQVLNTDTLMRDLAALFSRQNGYARSQGYIIDVGTDVRADPATGTLTIPLVEGRVQSFQVQGLRRLTFDDVLRPFHAQVGEVLNENVIQQDLTCLYDTGVFESVGPYQLTPSDVGQLTVGLPVQEKATLTDADVQSFPARAQIAAAYVTHGDALPDHFPQFAALFAPDFRASDSAGAALTRAQYLQLLTGPLGPSGLVAVGQDITGFRLDGDQAVVSVALHWYQWDSQPDGGLGFRQSAEDTWVRAAAGWSLESRKATSAVTKTVSPPFLQNLLRRRAK